LQNPSCQHSAPSDRIEVLNEIAGWLGFNSDLAARPENKPPQLFVVGKWELEVPTVKDQRPFRIYVDESEISVVIGSVSMKVQVEMDYSSDILNYLLDGKEEIAPATLRAIELSLAIDSLSLPLSLARRLNFAGDLIDASSFYYR